MSAKDRITAYVCTNADGSEKLPLVNIGTAKIRDASAGPVLQQQDCLVYFADVSKVVQLRISTPHSLSPLHKCGFVGGQSWVTF